MKNQQSISLKFPFPVRQTEDNVIKIDLGGMSAIPFPSLEPQAQQAEEFDRRFGVDLSKHEAIIDSLNQDYRKQLVLATIKITDSNENL